MSGGYVRQSAAAIVTGLIVAAAPVNAEFNALQSAFSAVTGTGHAHDGTTGGGAQIDPSLSLLSGHYVPLGNGGTNADLSTATTGASFIMGASGFTYVKNNFAGTVAPTITNDSSQGYQITSLWLDTVGQNLYMCISAVIGAASWINITASSGIAATIGKLYNSSADTVLGYGTNKIVASTLMVSATLNGSGNESMNIKSAAYTASGTNTYAITPSPAITSYASGQAFFVIFSNANTGASTINVNGLGAKSITKNGTVALSGNEIAAGSIAIVIYDGTEFQLIALQHPDKYYVASGTNTYAATPTPAVAAYVAGQTYFINFANANTGAATLNFNALGAKNITKNGTATLIAGDIPAGGIGIVVYDGTEFQLLNPFNESTYFVAAGTNTYTVAAAPAITGYNAGQAFLIKFTNANTTAATINFSSVGAAAIVKNGASALVSGDIAAGSVWNIVYDGTNFVLSGQVYILPAQPSLQLTSGGTQNANFNATVNNKYVVDTSSAIVTATMPGSASAGDIFVFAVSGPYQIGINPNGLNCNGTTSTQYFDGGQTMIVTYSVASQGYV